MRYKQFVSETVLEKTKDFLGTDKSYRKTVRHQHRSLVYDDRQAHPLAERGAAMAHSSVWRWLSWLGDAALAYTASYNFAKLIAIGVVLFWNFFANRLWTYRGL